MMIWCLDDNYVDGGQEQRNLLYYLHLSPALELEVQAASFSIYNKLLHLDKQYKLIVLDLK